MTAAWLQVLLCLWCELAGADLQHLLLGLALPSGWCRVLHLL